MKNKIIYGITVGVIGVMLASIGFRHIFPNSVGWER